MIYCLTVIRPKMNTFPQLCNPERTGQVDICYSSTENQTEQQHLPTYVPACLPTSAYLLTRSREFSFCAVIYAPHAKEMPPNSEIPRIVENRCTCRNPLWVCAVRGLTILSLCSTQEVNQTFPALDINNNPILKGGSHS